MTKEPCIFSDKFASIARSWLDTESMGMRVSAHGKDLHPFTVNFFTSRGLDIRQNSDEAAYASIQIKTPIELEHSGMTASWIKKFSPELLDVPRVLNFLTHLNNIKASNEGIKIQRIVGKDPQNDPQGNTEEIKINGSTTYTILVSAPNSKKLHDFLECLSRDIPKGRELTPRN